MKTTSLVSFPLGTDTFSVGSVPDTNTSCHIIVFGISDMDIYYDKLMIPTDSGKQQFLVTEDWREPLFNLTVLSTC